MKERHWQAVSEKVGFEVRPTEGFNFQKVLDMGLMTHVDSCVLIGEKAEKEFNIENMLNSMYEKWDQIEFKLKPWKNTYII